MRLASSQAPVEANFAPQNKNRGRFCSAGFGPFVGGKQKIQFIICLELQWIRRLQARFVRWEFEVQVGKVFEEF